MTDSTVIPFLRVVANGVEEHTGKMKATILVTPQKSESANAFELAEWPGKVAEQLCKGLAMDDHLNHPLTLRWQIIAAGNAVLDDANWNLAGGISHKLSTSLDWSTVNRLWAASFEELVAPKDLPTRWDSGLAQALEHSMSHAASPVMQPVDNYTVADKPPDLDYSQQGSLVDQQGALFDQDGAILSDPPESSAVPSIAGVVPIRQADFAIDEERERALRVQLKLQSGPTAVNEALAAGDDCENNPTLGTKHAIQEAIRTQLYKDYQDSIAATNPDRAITASAFTATKSILMGTHEGAPAACMRSSDSAILPSSGQHDAAARVKARGSHTYGTWLNRRKKFGCRKSETQYHAPAISENQLDQQQRKIPDDQKLMGMFYTLQGDPLLSRLFCLAVDIEFDLPDALHNELPHYLHLAIGESWESALPLVITAARYERGSKSFWPVSIFEAGLDHSSERMPINVPAYVEQRDGIWNLGLREVCSDQGVPVLRYDLSSLDMRRAVDSKQEATDRGERHITGGFSILDRGRGNQIAREMALAVSQKDNAQTADDVIILYAENLTAGRRVDVAAVKCGATVDESLQWRSLMSRSVKFDFGKLAGANRVLAALMPHALVSPGRFLEETSFQVAARHLPMLSAESSATEIVAEEAIFLWDGTPASVLMHHDMDTTTKPMDLPFRRHHEPPKYNDEKLAKRKLRPPPLRYGVPYVFSLRSVFAGGGSPSAEIVGIHHRRNRGVDILPPVNATKLEPRRFLRHESIQAPSLLLPAHLALKRYGVMGFEQLDQAIVRTGISSAETIAGECTTAAKPSLQCPAHQPPYAALRERINPNETMRVFVAPEASLDDVARHGKLDGPDLHRVLRGGLREAAFMRHSETDTDGAPKTSGFPSVVTRRLQALDGEAVYKREYTHLRGKEPGLSVFDVGGRHDVSNDVAGWLPDPAAWQFSIRASVRGSDRYLEGDLTADLYDSAAGIQYPDALPLVISVTRKIGVRENRLASSITDLARAREPTAALRWLSNDGGVSQLPGGAHVRHIVLELFEGEDYDLEVACLPRAESYANTFSLPQTVAQQRAHAAVDEKAKAVLLARCGEVDFSSCKDVGSQSMSGLAGNPVPNGQFVTGIALELVSAMRTRWPIEEIAAVARLRVCHAINKPSGSTGLPVWDTIEAIRPSVPTDQNFYKRPSVSQPGAKTILLTGDFFLDLEQVDSFEVIAEAVATSGGAMDDRTRSRSLISRRSGRWPKRTTPNGERISIAPRYVVGFDVEDNGRVTLPREKVTLLRVDNLPVPGAIGALLNCQPPAASLRCAVRGAPGEVTGAALLHAGHQDPCPVANPVFGDTKGRLTAIHLGCLHAAAIATAKIEMSIAMPQDAIDHTTPRRVRLVKTTQPNKIVDTRARRLTLWIRALSRFAETFETTPVYLNQAEPLLRRRQALKEDEQSVEGSPLDVWVPATERPAACDARRPEPTFVVERKAAKGCHGRTLHVLHRRTLTRLYFGRGWFSSGEGERLGIVLWPPDYFNNTEHDLDADRVTKNARKLSVADFDDRDLGPGGTFITRWGGDPIREDARPQKVVFIPPTAFADAEGFVGEPKCDDPPHKPRTVPRALMPVRREMPQGAVKDDKVQAAAVDLGDTTAGEELTEFLQVSLLTYEPCFDLDREEWYVDVDLRTYRPSEPIVRFGLVRYQEHAIGDEFMVSDPVVVSVPLLPPRRLEVTGGYVNANSDCVVDVSLVGPGSVGIKDLHVADTFAKTLQDDPDQLKSIIKNFASIQRPILKVFLFHENKDENGSPLSRTSIPIAEAEAELQPEVIDEELVWKRNIVVPAEKMNGLGRGRLVIYVEEIDRRMASTYASEPIPPQDQFKTFVDSGPRFSARVPFLEIDSRIVESVDCER